MSAPYILARTLTDAHRFAQDELGVGKGQYRIVTSPSSISGRRGVDLYLVPGYEKRQDRFAMKGALRYARLNVIDVEEWRQSRDSVPDDLDPAGVQLILEATDFFMDPEPPSPEQTDPEPEQTEESVKRRRRRCKECQTLHFKDEACVETDPIPGV